MLVLISYDIKFDVDGQTRLRKVAKECLNYGQRVQNSVFECEMDMAEARLLENRLKKIINLECDSVRFYFLGSYDRIKFRHIGVRKGIDINNVVIV